MNNGPLLHDWTLEMAAGIVGDLEAVKIANENRLRQLTDTTEYGRGLDSRHPDVKVLTAIVDGIAAQEHQAILHLQRSLRRHPLGPWVKSINGVGEKQCARLLACIGDPYWNESTDQPRTLRQLWRFCGMDVVPADAHASADGQDRHGVGVAPRKQRGQLVTWNPEARQRVWLIADRCMINRRSAYRHIYDAGRAKYTEAIHEAPCIRCGPKGKPAQVGSALSNGHQHARALRLVAKDGILRDLWREAKRIHEETAPGDQRPIDSHSPTVAGEQAA